MTSWDFMSCFGRNVVADDALFWLVKNHNKLKMAAPCKYVVSWIWDIKYYFSSYSKLDACQYEEYMFINTARRERQDDTVNCCSRWVSKWTVVNDAFCCLIYRSHYSMQQGGGWGELDEVCTGMYHLKVRISTQKTHVY